MKNLLGKIMLIVICTIAANTSFAQCTPDNSLTQPGLYPLPDSLPCFSQNSYNEITIYFKNYDTVRYNGLLVHIDSVTVDTVGNMPAGYRWTSNEYNRNNTFSKLESGCLLIWGSTTDPVGQYRLNIAVRGWAGGIAIPVNASSLGLYYDIRVIANDSANCPARDTSSGATLQHSTDNGGKGTNNGLASVYTGINDIHAAVDGMSNHPNPFSGKTEITFSSKSTKDMTFRVYNTVGQVIEDRKFNATAGVNTLQFDSKGLQAGVYFYNIIDGSNISVGRMIVTQ